MLAFLLRDALVTHSEHWDTVCSVTPTGEISLWCENRIDYILGNLSVRLHYNDTVHSHCNTVAGIVKWNHKPPQTTSVKSDTTYQFWPSNHHTCRENITWAVAGQLSPPNIHSSLGDPLGLINNVPGLCFCECPSHSLTLHQPPSVSMTLPKEGTTHVLHKLWEHTNQNKLKYKNYIQATMKSENSINCITI